MSAHNRVIFSSLTHPLLASGHGGLRIRRSDGVKFQQLSATPYTPKEPNQKEQEHEEQNERSSNDSTECSFRQPAAYGARSSPRKQSRGPHRAWWWCPSEITTIYCRQTLLAARIGWCVIIMDDSDDIEADSSGSVDVDRIVVAMGVPSDVKLETMVWTLVPISVLVSVPVTMIVEVVSLGG
ncbi:hypothetical protein FA13DRAFT_954287 [Coprinellus micaceus]|uniref:Uncharacterized protein n=1 Tax=Coprinellus micaceus TaxID=71717 RepID=A0A4Y7RY27_COPMI|nr:hypothetical protein FA13DRAFT_954287 [Coprinellus micaceus]